MAITLRSTSTVAAGTRTNTTVNAPTGHAANDVIVVGMECGGSSLVQPTGPAGWTLLGRVTYTDNDPWHVDIALWAKVRDGSSSWTWTHASRSTQAFAWCLTGVDNTNMADATAVTAAGLRASGTGLTAVAPSLTTITANAWRLILRGSWDGNAITAPSGWTEDYDAPVIWAGHREEATPGASGTVSVSAGNSGSQFTWGIIHAAIRPDTGGGATNYDGTSTAASTASVASSGEVGAVATATASSTASVASGGVVGKVATSAVAATVAIAASGVVGLSASSTISETAATSSSGAAVSGTSANSTIASTASVASTGIVGRAAGATPASTATIASSGVVGRSSGASVASTASITSSGSVVTAGAGSSTIASTAAIAGSGVVGTSSSAAVGATGAIASTGAVAAGPNASSSLASTGSITAAGLVATRSLASIATAAQVYATGTVGVSRGASVSSTATVAASGVVIDPGAISPTPASRTVTVVADVRSTTVAPAEPRTLIVPAETRNQEA